MRNGIKIILTVLVVVMFSLMAIASGSDSGKAEKVGEVSPTAAESTEAGSPEETAADIQDGQKQTETPATSPEIPSEIHVGDIIETRDLRIVYVASGDYYTDNEFMQPAEGNKYIFIRLYFENTASDDSTVSVYDFECYADGYSTSQFYGGENDLSATLSAGRSTMGEVYFEVPQSAISVEIEYELNFISEEKLTFVFEGDLDSGFVPEANTAATEDAFVVGDIVDLGGAVITYLSCELYESDNPYLQPAEGNCYISLTFDVENTSDSDLYISSYSFDCYADGASCDECYARDDELSATLSPGRKANGTVSFEVPIDSTVVEVEYLENIWTSNRVVFKCK